MLTSSVFLQTSIPNIPSITVLSLHLISSTRAPLRATLYTGSTLMRVPGYRPVWTAELRKTGPNLPHRLIRQRDARGSPFSSLLSKSVYLLSSPQRTRDASCLAPPARIRTCSFPAYGSYLGSKRQMLAVCAPAPVTRSPGSASGTRFADSHFPWSPPFAPPAPQRIAPLCSPASQLLWWSPTSHARASSATAPRLPDADQNIFVTGQTRDIPGSDAILLRVMWSSTRAGRQCLA